jgi:hypothetical protein
VKTSKSPDRGVYKGRSMYVRKVRGQDKVGRIRLTPTEIMYVQRAGLKLEAYVKHTLMIIAKQRRWKWYLNKERT